MIFANTLDEDLRSWKTVLGLPLIVLQSNSHLVASSSEYSSNKFLAVLCSPFVSSRQNHGEAVYEICRRRAVCYQVDEPCTLVRDAMRDFVAITCNAWGALITYQASFVGLDKKLSNPIGLLNFLEVPPRFELGIRELQSHALPLGYGTVWSGLRGSNSLPPPWQGGALPDELNPHFWRPESGSNRRPLA